MGCQGLRNAFQIHGVPQNYGCRYQIQTAGSLALLVKTAVTDFPKSIKEDRPRQGIPGLALVQTGMDAAAQFNAL